MIFNRLFINYLIEQQALTEELAAEWLERADAAGTPIYLELIKGEIMEEEPLYRLLADFLGYEYRFCQLSEISLEFVKQYPRDLLIEYQGVPLTLQGDVLTVLGCNPFRVEEFRELLTYGGKKMKFLISPPTQMARILDYANNKIQQDIVLTDYSKSTSDITEASTTTPIDAPIIKLCDSILRDAINRGASDIHIEPFDKTIYLRFRIDGKLNKIEELMPHMFPALLARYKIMADLNIAERRVPQDGKISMTVNGVPFDFRVSTIPTIHGEKIVIRIYNRGGIYGDCYGEDVVAGAFRTVDCRFAIFESRIA